MVKSFTLNNLQEIINKHKNVDVRLRTVSIYDYLHNSFTRLIARLNLRRSSGD